jgi:branched-chain amino acid transport system permease protein
MNYVLHILVLVSIYGTLGMSLNLLAGYSGLMSLCHAAFYGLGAYITALLELELGWPWLATLPVSLLGCGVSAWMIGQVTLRFRDDHFVIATFAFQIIVHGLMLNWSWLTQGPMGLPGIARPQLFGLTINDNWEFLLLSVSVLGICSWSLSRLVRAPFGRCLMGIREDEQYVTAIGKNTAALKTAAFVIGALYASICGSMYAAYITFIDPSSFTVNESIFILVLVILGGAGRLYGPLLGAMILIGFSESLRFVGLSPGTTANVRQILYGSSLVVCMLWCPKGLSEAVEARRYKRRLPRRV